MKHYKIVLSTKEPFGYVELGAGKNGWCRSVYKQRFGSLKEATEFLKKEFASTLEELNKAIAENGDDVSDTDVLDVDEDSGRCEIRSEYYTSYIFEVRSCR